MPKIQAESPDVNRTRSMALRLARLSGRVALAVLIALQADGADFVLGHRLIPGQTFSAAVAQPGQIAQPSPAAPQLRIVVLEGEDAVNLVRKKTAVQPVVEVRDKNNNPVAGAIVVFTTPESGPSAVFSGGTHSFRTVTDAQGRARVSGMQPSQQGKFEVSVSVTVGGAVANATISQTNAMAGGTSVPTNARTGLLGSHWALIGIVAAVAVAATVAGVELSHSSPSATISPTTGTPVVSAP